MISPWMIDHLTLQIHVVILSRFSGVWRPSSGTTYSHFPQTRALSDYARARSWEQESWENKTRESLEPWDFVCRRGKSVGGDGECLVCGSCCCCWRGTNHLLLWEGRRVQNCFIYLYFMGIFYWVASMVAFLSDEVDTPEHHVVYAVVILVNPCSHMMHVSSLAVTVCYTWGLMLARNVFIW